MKKPKSLSANIFNLLNSQPKGFDEDDEIDGSSAKVLTPDSDDSEQGEINERSKIRAQNIDLLESVDEKYAGKVSSRKRYRDSDSDDELQEEDTEEESPDDEGSKANDGKFRIQNTNRDSDDDFEEMDTEEASNDGEGGEESETEEGSDGSDMNSEHSDTFKTFTEATSIDEGSKGGSVRKQLNIWESFLEMRIKSKKGLSACNKMPIGEKLKDIFRNTDEEYKNKLFQTNKNVTNLLEKMISLQALLLNKNPETKKLLTKDHGNEEEDDAEISSEEDLDEEATKRSKFQHYGKDLSEKHGIYRIYRNKTIEKWYDKTIIKHTQSNSHTIVDQINHILIDKSKLLRRTQLKRSSYRIIGETEKEVEAEYDVNIYDDEDFYHEQLRELVEFKSSDITDPLQLSRQWVQLQNMRSKMKRKIDTRATKGRKLRFGVHSKLVNHAACRYYGNSKTEDAKKELKNSIFKTK